jgi:hypothetical protein
VAGTVLKNIQNRISYSNVTSDQVLRELNYDPSLVSDDMESLLQLGAPRSMVRIDMSRVQNLQRNLRMRAWLSVDDNIILLANGCSSNADLSTSFASANLVNSLRQQASRLSDDMLVIVLAYFCSQHRDYRRDEAANPVEPCMSLLLQLVDSYPGFNAADLQECSETTDPRSSASICTSLENLLNRLPPSAVVYLVIDGISFFAVPPERLHSTREAIELLVNLYRQSSSTTLKFLFCSPVRFQFVEGLFDED